MAHQAAARIQQLGLHRLPSPGIAPVVGATSAASADNELRAALQLYTTAVMTVGCRRAS